MDTILIFEDDRVILEGLKINLESEGFKVLTAGTGKTGLQLFEQHPEIQLVLLDIMLPDISGFEICKNLKTKCQGLIVLFLTARTDIYDKISGFTLGADDYITKPFDVRELILRIRARLKKVEAAGSPEEILLFGNVKINLLEYKVYKAGEDLKLTKVEFELLLYLYRNQGRVLTREMLLERLWDFNADVESRAVDMQISKLRKKIEDDPRKPRVIETVFGIGYKFNG
ncbi:MAG: response regulator transcription factor [Candidatus Wallbacteria bacterium]|nr:response regulator transcription factor [Candidatus Wallbacteria bacterium]